MLLNKKKMEMFDMPDAEPLLPAPRKSALSFRRRVLIVFISFVAYLTAFMVITNVYGLGGPTSAVLPVAVTGWLFGFWPGVCVALLAFPANLLISIFLGAGWSSLVGGGGIAGMVAIMLIGAAVGRLRDVTLRLEGELVERSVQSRN